MAKPFILGIVGYTGVGKSECFEAFHNKEPGKWVRLDFTDRLKTDLRALTIGVGADVYDRDDYEKLRSLIAAWGTAARSFDPRYLIDQVMMDIRKMRREERTENVVITDVRYKAEAEVIVENGGGVVYLERHGVDPWDDEEGVNIEYIRRMYPHMPVVKNYGNLDELAAEIYKVMASLRSSIETYRQIYKRSES